MDPGARGRCCRDVVSGAEGAVATTLLTHARLEADGYALRTVRFGAHPCAARRIRVGLVWRRRCDRSAEIRHVSVTREQAQLLLTGLGGLAAF